VGPSSGAFTSCLPFHYEHCNWRIQRKCTQHKHCVAMWENRPSFLNLLPRSELLLFLFVSLGAGKRSSRAGSASKNVLLLNRKVEVTISGHGRTQNMSEARANMLMFIVVVNAP
jgi:hypothetical protein